jgi:hypothetical protein
MGVGAGDVVGQNKRIEMRSGNFDLRYNNFPSAQQAPSPQGTDGITNPSHVAWRAQ